MIVIAAFNALGEEDGSRRAEQGRESVTVARGALEYMLRFADTRSQRANVSDEFVGSAISQHFDF